MGFSLPAAVIMFPIVYIVNDIIAEIYDIRTGRNVIITAFIMNIVAVIAYTVAIELPPSAFFTGQAEFSMVLGTSFRTLIASLTAYIVGSFVNLIVMNRLKGKSTLMYRCVISTLLGECMDALMFISIAFIGTMPVRDLLIMVLCQGMFKTLYESVVFPITNMIITKIKQGSR